MSAYLDWKPIRVLIRKKHLVNVYELIPEKLVSSIPVVICPGWMEVPESHRTHMEWLAAHGRHVIAYDAPHGLPILNSVGVVGHQIELEKMETLIEVLNGIGISRVDLIGRSEGAIWALLTAHHYEHYKRVRNIILQNPAGLIGPDWWLPFFFRWIGDQKQMWRNEERDPPPYAPISMGSVFMRDPWRSIKALWAIADGNNMHSLLKVIRSHDIKLAIVSTNHDRLFSLVRILAATIGFIERQYILRGSHTSYFSRPEEFAAAINTALTDLE